VIGCDTLPVAVAEPVDQVAPLRIGVTIDGADGVVAHGREAQRRTWAAMRGVSHYDIADVLGDDYKTVEKHYWKYQPKFLRGAVEGSTTLPPAKETAGG
jgi:hypothetical protein